MNSTNIVIRSVHANDLPHLSALWYEKVAVLSQQDRRWQIDENARPYWEQQAAAWLNDVNCAIQVAAKASLPIPSLPRQSEGSQPLEGKILTEVIVGYCIGWVQAAPPGVSVAALGMITDLAIDVHGYHSGAARALVTAMRAWFASQGVSQVVASVPQRDAVAQAFWRSYGASEWMDWLWITS